METFISTAGGGKKHLTEMEKRVECEISGFYSEFLNFLPCFLPATYLVSEKF